MVQSLALQVFSLHLRWECLRPASDKAREGPQLIKQQLPNAQYVDLPPGFLEAYSKETATKDTGFLSKATYLNYFNAVRECTLTELGKLKDADLDRPTQGKMAAMAPNLGSLFLLVSNHVLMHAGQFTVIRRKLGKPVLF